MRKIYLVMKWHRKTLLLFSTSSFARLFALLLRFVFCLFVSMFFLIFCLCLHFYVRLYSFRFVSFCFFVFVACVVSVFGILLSVLFLFRCVYVLPLDVCWRNPSCFRYFCLPLSALWSQRLSVKIKVIGVLVCDSFYFGLKFYC